MALITHVRRVAAVGSVEAIAIAAGGVAGLLIVNFLNTDQYAQYTFLLSCMTLMLGVADLGLSSCCLPVVGQRAHDVSWVVGVCRRVFHWRWLLLAGGLAIVMPYWIWVSREHGWWSPGYGLASAVVLLLVLSTLREHLGNTLLVILGQLRALYKISLSATVVRTSLVCLALALPLGAFSAAGVLAATATASLLALWMYRRAFATLQVPDARLGAEATQQVDRQTLRIARPLVLPSIFYQVQGVAVVFLGAVFGSAEMLAQVGAFGRLAMVLLLVDRITSTLLFPALARAPDGPTLVSNVIRVHVLYLLAMALIELTAIMLPQYWIILLGEQYRSMTPYVWIVFLAAMLTNASGLAYRTLTVRGATSNQSYGVGFILAVQVLYLWYFGAGDLRILLGFNLATALAHFGFQYLMLALQLPKLRRPISPGTISQPTGETGI